MSEAFLIYIDRLKGGSEEEIDAHVAADYMELEDTELEFCGQIAFTGKAYMADDHLIIHLDVTAEAKMPCKLCNESKPVQVVLDGFYHTEPLENIREAIFDMKDVVRDAILLEIPSFYECDESMCEGRAEAQKFLKSKPQKDDFLPFADL